MSILDKISGLSLLYKVLGSIGLILAAVGLFFGAKAIYDHSVVSKHDAKIEASQAKADRAADQNASVAKEHDLNRQNQEADELIKVQENAKSTTDRRLAFHRCLRLQQHARENGLQPPRCV